jgi:hypothetical protein
MTVIGKFDLKRHIEEAKARKLGLRENEVSRMLGHNAAYINQRHGW